MNLSNIIPGATNAAGAVQGVSNAVAGFVALFGSPGGSISFQSQIKKSSWRGVPFITLSADTHVGRKKATHEYPFRDLPWIEDMGRATRKFNVTGFLLGDDVISQRLALLQACEKPGPGELVHGTLGKITVDLLACEFVEKWDAQRYFEVSMQFAQGGQRIYPAVVQSTAAVVAAAGVAAHAASAASFMSTATSALKSGAAVVSAAVSTATGWISKAVMLVKDATTIFHAVSAVVNTATAFFGGRISSLAGVLSAVQGTANAVQRATVATGSIAIATQTTQSLAAAATASRNAVTQSADYLMSTTGSLGL